MFIDPIEFKTFLRLQQNPLLKVSDIAEKLGITFYKANKAYNSLFEKELVKGISSVISPRSLNLERHEVMFEISKYKSVLQVEEILKKHNYTRYHSRYTLGSTRGIYAQFDIPTNCKNFLIELSEKLKDIQCVDKFKFLEKGDVVATTGINLKYINWESLNWNFDTAEWFKTKIKKVINCDEDKNSISSNGQKINDIDLWILRSLSKNAMFSNIDILKDIEKETKELLGKKREKDLSTISRRLKYVKDNYISDNQLLINNKLFNLSTQIMFNVTIADDVRDKLCQKMKQQPLPFRSALTETKTGFRWLIRCPSEYISELTNYIWKWEPTEMSVFYLMPESKLYWFYPLNYDVLENSWKDSYEHFFEPIQKLIN
ncbi:MAG: hypothetical protein KGD64_15280 [Candidatus Heimdallarchaeota archaeon]|nr:hypothetical protein [Candidatus Heimdallarchaeota archaeon]